MFRGEQSAEFSDSGNKLIKTDEQGSLDFCPGRPEGWLTELNFDAKRAFLNWLARLHYIDICLLQEDIFSEDSIAFHEFRMDEC